MSSAVSYAVHGRVAVIQMDAPPVNSLGFELRQAIAHSLSQALQTASVDAIVLIGSDRAFSGGADVREFGTSRIMQEPSLRTLNGTIEGCAKPVVAAISGACMGGGFELALACHYRVAKQDAAIALPEVKLGIMPGAGGTQRLPRAVGLKAALDMILSGKTVRADSLRGTDAFDEVVTGDLRLGAIAFAEKLLADQRPLKRVRDQKVDDSDAAAVLATAEAGVAETSKGHPAPLKCLQAIAATLTLPFEEGIELETQLCNWLISTPESKALRYLFAAERAATKIPGISAETSVRSIRQVAILGAGELACGIAMCCLDAGLSVIMIESERQTRDRGMEHIISEYENSLSRGEIRRVDRDRRLSGLRAAPDFSELRDCDLIIDAVDDAKDQQQRSFQNFARYFKDGAILASSDSYADLGQMATMTGRPQDMIILNFFDPVRTSRLIEVGRSERTGTEVLATCLAFAKRLNKIPVVCRERAGLIRDRMLRRHSTVVKGLLARGATKSQIDRCLAGFGISSRHHIRTKESFEPSSGLSAGKQGTGEAPDDGEIIDHCVYASANEGAHILEEGIALRSSDIDLVCVHGCGFPAHRGGPMYCASEAGLAKIATALKSFAADTPGDEASWTISPLLERLAASQGSFA